MKKTTYIIIGVASFALFYVLTKKSINAPLKKGARVILDKTLSTVKSFATSISDYGKSLIKHLETLSLKVYKDAGGFSIGYGHYLGLTPTISLITTTQAETYFNQDVLNVESEMRKYIKVQLTQNQHDALVSFFYNVGHKGFINKDGSQTQILQKLNKGDFIGAANEFDRWTHASGIINSALVDRRSNEKALFLK